MWMCFYVFIVWSAVPSDYVFVLLYDGVDVFLDGSVVVNVGDIAFWQMFSDLCSLGIGCLK